MNPLAIRTLCICLFISTALVLPAQRRKIVVAQDGSGNYRTVQQAFDAVPAGNRDTVDIFVKKGVYRERLTLAAGKDLVRLRGEDAVETVLVNNAHAGSILPDGDTVNTYTSASVFLLANAFTAQNITFANDAGFNAGQAVAVFAGGDRLVFRNCRFIGYQDVLFCSGENSRQYYLDCYIEGTTDFIFGPAIAVFDNCHIHSKKNSHVTAASTPPSRPFGFVFRNCRLTGDSSLHNVSLGRPWRPYASVTYLQCEIGPHILPEGWNNWKNPENEKTARFAEYRNTGPGASREKRVGWVKQLTDAEAARYTLKEIFPGWDPVSQL